MPRARSAYWTEFQQAIRLGLARELSGYEAIEALKPIQIAVRWKQKTRAKGVLGWREYFGVAEYTPGQILHREWRAASGWEVEEWQDLSDDQLGELGVFRQQRSFSIQIVEKIKDLPAAIRQRGRHIPGRKIFRQGRNFVLPGHAQVLAQHAASLSSLLQRFLEQSRPSPQEMEQASLELSQISSEFDRRKTALVRHANAEIQLALQGRFWELPAHASQAAADLLAERRRDYEIAMASLDLAQKWRDLMADIERRFRNAYTRLGKLGEELQGLMIPGQSVAAGDLLRIAKAAHEIWAEFEKEIPRFNPYYAERLQTTEFQRLFHVLDHAEAGRDRTVLNDITLAASKVEAVAIGERPTRAELTRERQTLF